AGRAQHHGIAQRQALWQRNKPIALDPGALAEPAPMHLADAPAGEYDQLPLLITRIAAGPHRAGKIDASDMGIGPHQAATACQTEAILVVDAGPGDIDGDIARWQGSFLKLPHGR